MAVKAMYKYELALAAGVSQDTFRKWCRDHRDTLIRLGCHPRCQLLTPAAVDFLCQQYCIHIN